jgi:hypothetical protein
MERNEIAGWTAAVIGGVSCIAIGLSHVFKADQPLPLSPDERDEAKALQIEMDLQTLSTSTLTTTNLEATGASQNPSYITNSQTGADYKIVPDPENKGRQCIEKGYYTPESPNTLVGMTVALGPNSSSYIDITGGVIYDSSKNVIGYFGQEKLIEFEDLTAPAYPDAVACANN